MVDAAEWAWVREHVTDSDHPFDHLVLASTLPWLMLPGVHHLEGWDEAVSEGAWGRPGKWLGERVRQVLDLEHWAAFRESFDETVELLAAVVTAPAPPATVLMLGGDVHCNYTAAAELTDVDHPATTIHQLTMSPFRNDIPRVGKLANRWLNRRTLTGVVHRMCRWAKVPDVAITWHVEHGPWFDNGVMTVEFAGRSARLRLDHAGQTEAVRRSPTPSRSSCRPNGRPPTTTGRPPPRSEPGWWAHPEAVATAPTGRLRRREAARRPRGCAACTGHRSTRRGPSSDGRRPRGRTRRARLR